MSSPPSSPRSPSIPVDLVAAAAERRTRQATLSPEAQFLQEHEKRQTFRRLVDPGIVRPNSHNVAVASLKTLSTIAENLLREPDNPKFKQFKPTNSLIKRTLMDPKGALEYAIALGFRAEVENFQPYYSFNTKKFDDLRIGAAILKEFIGLQTEKQERLNRAREEEKAAAAAVVTNVKLAFIDDRKTKIIHDERERQLREARAAAPQAPLSPSSSALDTELQMPGSGFTLGANGIDNVAPPSYEKDDESEQRDDSD